jgi:hypothetical protein
MPGTSPTPDTRADLGSIGPSPADERGGARLDALTERVDDLARRLPATVDGAAATTGRALAEVQRTIGEGSDAALLAGSWMTAGLALGLLVGRAPRLVVAAALVAAVALGIALVDRRSGRLTVRARLPS